MDNKTHENLFEGMEKLGFKDLHNIKLYQSDEKKVHMTNTPKEENIEDFLYDRKITCPVCEANITVRAVKSFKIRRISQDSDFMVNYKGVNPMLYDIWVCTNCGYAASSAQFNNILDKQKELVKNNISCKWKPRTYPEIYTLDIAVERYKVALLNSIVKKSKISERALLCLKIGWIYRLQADEKNEKKFLYQALQGFEKAFENEMFPIVNMNESSLSYLIGELYRKLGNDSKALKWFSRVLSSSACKKRVKDMARDQKYLIMDKRKQESAKKQEKTDKKSSLKKKKHFISNLFASF